MPAHAPTIHFIVGSDSTAYIFTDHDAAGNDAAGHDAHEDHKQSSLGARIMDELKSFLPKVSRVEPVETKLASGEIVHLLTPENLH